MFWILSLFMYVCIYLFIFLWAWVCEFICVFLSDECCFHYFSWGFACLFFFFFFVGWFDFLLLSFFFLSVLCGLQSPDALARGQAWHSEVGDLSPGCGATRKLQTHTILNRENSPKGLYLNSKTWPHPKASNLQHQMSHAKQLTKTGTQQYTLADKLHKVMPSSQTPHNTLGATLPFTETGSRYIHQNTGTCPSQHETFTRC